MTANGRQRRAGYSTSAALLTDGTYETHGTNEKIGHISLMSPIGPIR
jgi:hypothetical protein